MQPLTAAPREDRTEAQVIDVLTGPEVKYVAGLELLDRNNRVVADITDQQSRPWQIEWNNRSAVRGICRVSLYVELEWGRARVRPYMIVSNPAVSARFNRPVFVLNKPDNTAGETPTTYNVSGSDLTSLLQRGSPANTYVVVAVGGLTYAEAMQQVITDSGIGATLHLSGNAHLGAMPETRVWALVDPLPSWLFILTDLAKEIGYTPPTTDPDGNITSGPSQDPATRTPEWVLDEDDPRNIIAARPVVKILTGGVANSWRFVRRNMTTTPAEGAGIYTPSPNETEGPNSIAALGQIVPRLEFLDVADQPSLILEGDRIRAADMARVKTISLSVNPLPLMGADDVFSVNLNGVAEKTAAASWTENGDGSNGDLELGGSPEIVSTPSQVQTISTVTTASVPGPLAVVVDGATIPSPANVLNDAVYTVGQRVTTTVRNPRPPLVLGVET